MLSPGETVDAAAVLLPQGSIARMAGGAVGGLVGVAAAHALSDKSAKKANDANSAGGGVASTFPLGAQMTVAATSQRLVVMKNSALSGKPKEIAGSIPWAQIAGVTIDSGALRKKLVLSFVDDTEVNLEAGKIIKLEPLADAITARAGR